MEAIVYPFLIYAIQAQWLEIQWHPRRPPVPLYRPPGNVQ
jgi:hypothetical protein